MLNVITMLATINPLGLFNLIRPMFLTAFFSQGVNTVSKVVVAIGIGLGIYGAINLFEGYSSDNPGAKAQGLKQLVSGAGIVLIATTLFPLLASQF